MIENVSNGTSPILGSFEQTAEFAPISTIDTNYGNTNKQKLFLGAVNQYVNALNAAIQNPSDQILVENLQRAGSDLATAQDMLDKSSNSADGTMSLAFDTYIELSPPLSDLIEVTENPFSNQFDVEEALFRVADPLVWTDYATNDFIAFYNWTMSESDLRFE